MAGDPGDPNPRPVFQGAWWLPLRPPPRAQLLYLTTRFAGTRDTGNGFSLPLKGALHQGRCPRYRCWWAGRLGRRQCNFSPLGAPPHVNECTPRARRLRWGWLWRCFPRYTQQCHMRHQAPGKGSGVQEAGGTKGKEHLLVRV